MTSRSTVQLFGLVLSSLVLCSCDEGKGSEAVGDGIKDTNSGAGGKGGSSAGGDSSGGAAGGESVAGAAGGGVSGETGNSSGGSGPANDGGSGGTTDAAGGGGRAGNQGVAGEQSGGSAGESGQSGGLGGSAESGGTGTDEPNAGASAGGDTNLPDDVLTRDECPQSPPATQKDPASDRNLAISKDEYQALLKKEEPFVGTRGSLPWHSYTPEQATGNLAARVPLLVVLHGGYGREVADGNILVDVAQYLLGSQNGLLTPDNRRDFPTYIIAPHCRVEEGCEFGSNEWASAGGAHFEVQSEPSVAGATALELIEHFIETQRVDHSRVYLTGNSMGGGGTWEFAQRRPDLFAAVLPVSGHTPNLQQLTTIADAKLPVWAFGAVNDDVNPYTDTVAAIGALSDAGGCAWLTTYNNAGHDDALWSSPYLEPGLWPWLFAQLNPSAPR